MKSGERLVKVKNLLGTSVHDLEVDISFQSDPILLCDLLIECHERGALSKEQVVRRRIAKLMKACQK